MLFNSLEFAVFVPIVFILYWFVTVKNLRLQNLLLLAASYFFYAWWDWRFLSLIIFSSIVDYTVGLALGKTNVLRRRKFLLGLSITINLGLLGFFKYYNFFAESFADAFTLLGSNIEPTSLNIILPVGISFYTFQTLSYTTDVYRKKLEPTSDALTFFSFVCFFPQLVAGPIERAANLLPQFSVKRTFNYSEAKNGMKQILWGLFKKVVIADSCAHFVNTIFDQPESFSPPMLVFGTVLFAFQIYGDFSGYSDIAIGTARLFGFNLMTNFAYPYFSRDIAEFWRRWHISLSTWFRDYLYIPLGGSRGGIWKSIRNVFIIFIVSGFWHGANWTFIIWGFLNALYFIPLLIAKKNRHHLEIVAQGKWLPSFKELSSMVITFALTSLAWIFFRAESLTHAFQYIAQIIHPAPSNDPYNFGNRHFYMMILLLIFISLEWVGRNRAYAIEKIGRNKHWIFRYGFYYALGFIIILLAQKQQTFIYFQF